MYRRNLLLIPPTSTSLFITITAHNIANKMMFMRTILALSLAAFALAVPVAQPQDISDVIPDVSEISMYCLSRYLLCSSLIDSP
jgi:hypothetical protein